MSRLDDLRQMRAFLDAEIAAEIERINATDAYHTFLLAKAATLYDVAPDDILGRNRNRRPMLARQAACWLLRNRAGLSYPRIGEVLGLDHSTVLHACRKVDAAPPVRAMLAGLEAVA